MKYIIETYYRPTGFAVQWIDDAIGDNEPRSIEACESDAVAFGRGDCGTDMAATFYSGSEGKSWRITEVPK